MATNAAANPGAEPHERSLERSRDAHARAILDAALEAVITIDHRGNVVEFNRAAERIFGFARDEVLGRELAGLIVPPELREAHRKALARWTEDGPGEGAGELVGTRVEVEAVRQDGSRLPVELAIARVDVPGPPVFTACLRDLTEQKATESALRQAEFRFRTLVEELPLVSYVDSSDDPAANALYISPQIEPILGYSVEEWLTTENLFESLIHEDDRERVLAERRDAYARGLDLHCEFRIRSKNGDVVWLEDRSVVVESPDGSSFRQGFAVDITERKRSDAALRRAEGRFRSLVEQLPLAVYVDRLDETSSNVYTSPQIEAMLGYTPEQWVSDPDLFVTVLHPDDRERVLAAHGMAAATREPLELEYRLIARDGHVVWVRDAARIIQSQDGGEPVLQGYLLDVTAQKQAEEQLRHQAFHDALTGLANRTLFTDRVEHALVVRSGSRRNVAVLIVDLDDFKSINDTCGHPTGDALLVAIATRFRAALSERHTVARLGGDEFAVLVEEASALQSAADVAERLLAELEAPFELDGRHVFVSASIGIAVGRDAEELMRSADIALYRAKAGGGAQYVVYAPRMDLPASDRLELVADIRRARIEDEFVLHYQPVVELATGRLVGVEALLRWQHPRRGLLAPYDFVPLAEETGRIVEIGLFVLEEACRQVAAWKKLIPAELPLSVSVNVSKRQVRRELAGEVRAALDASGLEPSDLLLEITDNVFGDGRNELTDVLDQVSELGVGFALDDFGKGYSSLSLLQDLPVEVLKIDRFFVGAIGTGLERTALVRAIVDLAHALGLEVVAEGIENAAHVAVLRRLGCRVGQGFHYAAPLPPDELERLLADGVLPRFPRDLRTPRSKVA